MSSPDTSLPAILPPREYLVHALRTRKKSSLHINSIEIQASFTESHNESNLDLSVLVLEYEKLRLGVTRFIAIWYVAAVNVFPLQASRRQNTISFDRKWPWQAPQLLPTFFPQPADTSRTRNFGISIHAVDVIVRNSAPERLEKCVYNVLLKWGLAFVS
jgi:hypothetical protein